MNDHTDSGVTDLLQRVTRDLTPDVADLLERATEQGRRTRRRHLAATALVGAGVLAGSVAAVPAIVDSLPGGSSGVAGVASNPTPNRRHVAVPESKFAETLSDLLPGHDPRTDLSDSFNQVDGVTSGTLMWHGAQVLVGIDTAPDPITDGSGASYEAGPSPSPRPAPKTPADWCRAMAGDQCQELPNGDWASSNDAAEPGNPSNFQITFALYTTDGYMVLAQTHGLTDQAEGRALESPLSVAQLRDIAESDAWLTN